MMSEPQLRANPAGFDAEIRSREGVLIAVRGELDMTTRDRLAQALDQACRLRGDVTLDAGGLRFCDASGISVLVVAYERLHAQGRHLAVTNANHFIHRLLDVAGVAYLRGPSPTRFGASVGPRAVRPTSANRLEAGEARAAATEPRDDFHPGSRGAAPAATLGRSGGPMVSGAEASESRRGLSSGGAAPDPGIAQDMGQLARDLQADPDQQAMRQRIAEAAVVELDGATWAGLTMVQGKHLSTVAMTADIVAEIDQLQYRAGDGPCLISLREHITVRSDDLRTETRWPKFAAAAARRGVLSVLSFQLFVEGDNLGSLNVYADKPDAFDDDESIGLLLASHAAIALNGANVEHNLRVALDSRDVIGQAKGILMERHKLTAQEAFDLLVCVSQRTHRKLHDLANELAATGELAVPATPTN